MTNYELKSLFSDNGLKILVILKNALNLVCQARLLCLITYLQLQTEKIRQEKTNMSTCAHETSRKLQAKLNIF